MPVFGTEAREPRKVKSSTKRDRPWYRPWSTYLTEYRILMRHDAASPGFRRASGRKRSTDNERVTQRVRPDRFGDPGAAGGPADDPRGAVPVQPLPIKREEDGPLAALA